MKFVTALLVALVALTGFAAAMVAPTTSGTMPANVTVFTDTNTPTTVGYFGLLAMPLNFGVPTGSFTSSTLGGNWEEPGPSSGTAPNWADVIASGVTTQGFEGYS